MSFISNYLFTSTFKKTISKKPITKTNESISFFGLGLNGNNTIPQQSVKPTNKTNTSEFFGLGFYGNRTIIKKSLTNKKELEIKDDFYYNNGFFCFDI